AWETLHHLNPDNPDGDDGGSGDPDDDGLANLDEWNATTDPRNFDTDGDGFGDGEEVEKNTDPLDPLSFPPDIQGTIAYTGSATGTYHIIASLDPNSWTGADEITLTSTGSWTLVALTAERNYWLKSYLDTNGNGRIDPCEPRGDLPGNPVYLVTNISGVSITLTDDLEPPQLSETPAHLAVHSRFVPEVPDITANDNTDTNVTVQFSAGTNTFTNAAFYAGSKDAGLVGYKQTGFEAELAGPGSRAHENFSAFATSPPNYNTLTGAHEGIEFTIRLKNETDLIEVVEPAAQLGASSLSRGVVETSSSPGARNTFIFEFSSPIGHFGLDLIGVASNAELTAFGLFSNEIHASSISYPNQEPGTNGVHFVGLSGLTPEIWSVELIAAGNADTLAFDNLRFGTDVLSEQIITRTWSATDACGNSTVYTQRIEVSFSAGPLAPPTGLTPDFAPNIWINEIHYNNIGPDVHEGVKIAGTAGLDLQDCLIILYDGANGLVYHTET
ncbi:MAG: hypothetical protein AAF492_21420, partial [Verrucomicrobiota bacterium]